MPLEKGLCLMLETDGAVGVYDGVNYLEDLEDAPPDLKVKDGSFQRFAEATATQHGFIAVPVLDLPHCFELDDPQ